jgi:formiminotetrahydrofolate cyclodeaminase
MLMDMTVKDFLAELASESPAPGGGSVSALAGSLAAALLSMVANLSAGVGDAEAVLKKSAALKVSLERDVDADTEAFNRVMGAYRLPKQTDGQKEKRAQAIQQALQDAALHPLKVARRCLDVMKLCRWAVTSGNPHALSDAGVASLMAQSGIRGALYNVEINLKSIKDAEFKAEMEREREQILKEARALEEDIEEFLESRLS